MTTLSQRDRLILDHVHRHRLSTREILLRQFLPGATLNAVGKVVSRLAADDWLREREIFAGFSYCVLGLRGARLFGTTRRAVRRFFEQTFPHAYGLLAFCVGRGLHRLTPD